MTKLTVKRLEAKRRELMLNKAEFAAWLGFTSNSKTKTRALISQYYQLCRALEGDKRYAAGIKTLRMVAEKLEANSGRI